MPLPSTRDRSVTERLNELTWQEARKVHRWGARALHFDAADIVKRHFADVVDRAEEHPLDAKRGCRPIELGGRSKVARPTLKERFRARRPREACGRLSAAAAGAVGVVGGRDLAAATDRSKRPVRSC